MGNFKTKIVTLKLNCDIGIEMRYWNRNAILKLYCENGHGMGNVNLVMQCDIKNMKLFMKFEIEYDIET